MICVYIVLRLTILNVMI